MRTLNYIKNLPLLGILILIGYNISAQNTTVFYNNGADVTVLGSNIFVSGSMENVGATANLLNNGDVTTTKCPTMNDGGHFVISSGANVSGSGYFSVEGDWENNANFITDNLTNRNIVVLNGDTQLITGSNVTEFYDLYLENSNSLKKQTLDAKVANVLKLNNNELATQDYVMYCTNPSYLGILYDNTYQNEGFVSSTGNGHLSRATNSQDTYIFPVGSTDGTKRFRPIELKPFTATSNTYTVSLVNNDATIDGYDISTTDSNICKVIPDFYHKINQTNGTSGTDITAYYDPSTDPSYINALGQWDVPQNSMWNDLEDSSPSNALGNYNSIYIPNYSDFTSDQFAFTQNRAPGPEPKSDDIICFSEDTILLVAEGSTAPYDWIFPPDVTVVSGLDNDSVYVVWGNSYGDVYVQGDQASSCASRYGNMFTVSQANIDADFDMDTTEVVSVDFLDLTMGDAVSWHWDFGDDYFATTQNATHTYDETGFYDVMLTSTDNQGCKDTLSKRIYIHEYIEIPNVFSPNGDGVNDVFRIPFVSHDAIFNLVIYNRWGEVLFESEASKIYWDGRVMNSGSLVPEGTYYYTLKAVSQVSDYSTTGHVTLLR